MASEMLYPVTPLYLQQIGFSVALIGVLEGIAEAAAGLSKGYFGKRSDLLGKRVPFVQLGYAISAIAKPLIAIFTFPLWVFLMRTADRLGKGIRTGARDAMLSNEASWQTKARIFGFHRSMDTLGAVLGPLLALLFLHFYPQEYRTLFFLALIPGILAVLVSLQLHEQKQLPAFQTKKVSSWAIFSYWKVNAPLYKKLVAGLLIFTLFNSSDMFLLLQAKQVVKDDRAVVGIYIFYNLVYALFAFPLGILADRIGLKKVFIIGLALFATVYGGMALAKREDVLIALFFLYGVYAAATEGVAKAWIANIVQPQDMATAMGTFTGLQSICALLASSLTGFLWLQFGAPVALLTTAIATLSLIAYFCFLPNSVRKIGNF